MGRKSTRISLMRMAFNPDSALAFGLCWKLAYAFSNPARPRLEVFVDDDLSRDGDWASYGAPDDQVTTISFAGIGDVQLLSLGDAAFAVRFDALGTRTITYQNGGPTDEPVYGFVVERVG